MLDTKAAYQPQVPAGPGSCQGLALAQVPDGRTLEFHIFGRWPEGKRERFNLVRFHNGTPVRTLRGWNGDLVEVL
jgi:hypothetical protein